MEYFIKEQREGGEVISLKTFKEKAEKLDSSSLLYKREWGCSR